MAIPTFIQNSRINQVIYQIRDDQLQVSARTLVGKFQDSRFDLRTLDPDYRAGFTRNHALLIVPLVTTVLSAGVFWSLWQQKALPREAVAPALEFFALIFAASLAGAIQGSRRIEYFQFNNLWGKPVLFIIRERSQTADCTTFITALVAHIELVQSDLPPAERAQLLRELSALNQPVPCLRPGQNRWIASILLGGMAAVFPFFFPQENQDSLFPFMFVLCLAGAALCVFSFLANESRRWWSVIGMLLALIPPFFTNSASFDPALVRSLRPELRDLAVALEPVPFAGAVAVRAFPGRAHLAAAVALAAGDLAPATTAVAAVPHGLQRELARIAGNPAGAAAFFANAA